MFFEKKWFAKHQKLLLDIANSEAGKYILGIRHKYHIFKVTPNSWHYLVDFKKDKPLCQTLFYCNNQVSQILGPIVEKMLIARTKKYEAFLHYSGLKFRNNIYPQIYLATQNFTSGAGDGYVRNSNNVWATCHDAASGNTVDAVASTDNGPSALFVNPTYYIDKTFLPFDTSSLGASATVSLNANDNQLSFFFNAKTDADTDTVYIVQTTQASNTTLALSDFSQMGTTSGGSATLASLTAATVNTMNLNSTGAGFIVNTGFTKLGLRMGRDLNNTAPTGSDQIDQVSMSENGTPANRPNLLVTYTKAITNLGYSFVI